MQNACNITMKVRISTDTSKRVYLFKDSIHSYQDTEGPGIFLDKRDAGDHGAVKRLDFLEYLNPRRTRGGKGWLLPPPIRFFFNFSNAIFRQHLPFSVAVGISLRHILTQVW